MAVGFSGDGTKVTRELGIRYSPVAEALREEIAGRCGHAVGV